MMKHAFSLSLVLGALVFVTNLPHDAVSAEPVVTDQEERLIIVNTDTPQVTAKAYTIFDVESGEILHAVNGDEQRPIASVTKLLFAAQALVELDLESVVTVTESDVATYGRAGKLQAGEQYTARELLFPLLLESSNDAATALARQVETVRFAGISLTDGSGLSDQNRASAVELAAAVRVVYRAAPHIFDITTVSKYIGPYTGWVNNSPVRDLPGYKGGKHGYTEAAGRTLAAVFAEESLDGRVLGYIILGSDDLVGDTTELRAFTERSVHLR